MDTISVRAWQPGRDEDHELDCEVELDRSNQKLQIDVCEDLDFASWEQKKPESTPIFPSVSGLPGQHYVSRRRNHLFVSTSLLGLKAKQFDDGLYAAIEFAADRGLGKFPSRRDTLRDLLQGLQTLPHSRAGNAAAIVAAATQLGGDQPRLDEALAKLADDTRSRFLSDSGRSKPLGFYTWSDELRRIFRRDRMLQEVIRDSDVATATAESLAANEDLAHGYESILHLAEQLTNRLAHADLRMMVQSLRDGRRPETLQEISLFPPSRSHETDLILKLYGDSPIPEGFELAEEMIRRVRDGSLSLNPVNQSGWYDHQTYALEPLIVPDRMPEGERLELSATYRRELEGVFKSLIALTRETHIKQLDVVECGAMGGELPPELQIYIGPGLTIEPIPSYYLRRSQSYGFVRDVLTKSFGEIALSEMFRLTASGPVEMTLAEEIDQMENLFLGAHLLSCRQIAALPDPAIPEASARRALDVYMTWADGLRKDPDLAEDIRMMVPVFYDIEREKFKVWAVLGVATKPLDVSFATPPEVLEVRRQGGPTLKPGTVKVHFQSEMHELPYLITAEVYVTEPHDREEFRKHCDRFQTFDAIIGNLH